MVNEYKYGLKGVCEALGIFVFWGSIWYVIMNVVGDVLTTIFYN